jgi:hypothetical protein
VEIVFYIEIGGGGDIDRGTNSVPSFGEREHALSLARAIQKDGYRPRFVVGPLIANHIRLAGFEPETFWSPKDGIDIVRKIDPAMVIACELFNVSPESATGLIEVSRSLGTMDGTSLPIEINTDPLQSPEYSRSLVLPDHYHSFRPSPVNDLGIDTDDAVYFALFPEAVRLQKDEGIYRSLGLDPVKKTVLFAAAPWAQGAAAMLEVQDQDYYQNLARRIIDGLEAAGESIDFFFVSMFPIPDMPSGPRGGVTVHYSGLIPYDSYDHVLCSCDLIASDNMIQTSVSKAVVMGIPHLIIQNTSPSEMPYPYNMFPLKLLFPSDRDYAQIIEVAEYGDPGEIREKTANIIARGYSDAEKLERRRDYLERLGHLSSPGQLIERIIGPAAESTE